MTKLNFQIALMTILISLMFSCEMNNAESAALELKSDQSPNQEPVYEEVDKVPVPANGFQEYYSWIASNLKYPEQARKEGLEGKVYIEFIVDKNGNLKDAKVLKGFDEACDQESLRVIKLSPKWSPGIKDDKKVNVHMVLPITFKLS